MINYFSIIDKKISRGSGSNFTKEGVVWIDLIKPTEKEKEFIEKTFSIELFTKQESEEIETSSKYIETEDEIGINLNFIKTEGGSFVNEPVSFIIKNKILVSQRDYQFRTFDDIYKKLKLNRLIEGNDIYLMILDARIDYDADLIEAITDKISLISKELVKEKDLDKELLLRITSLQETTIMIRENIVEKQRILSSMLKSKIFPKEDYETMRIMIKDVGSLLDHTGFSFERLEFLQNTFLGLIDIEQNRIIKLFTVVTVIFMPPTLIASMYGMNFRIMPELNWALGYPFAGVLMFLSSALTLMYFRQKKWL
ncbi:MAG: magnesium/cobalt transporter CorA [Lutibacter sp.]|nr:magnesium/cobalt transporter CorA [Lutibacter sp.]